MSKEESGKRQELLETAIEVFSAQGYRATSMRDLAEQVNLSKPTLYHYFTSKQELLVAIYDGVMAENMADARGIAEAGLSVEDSVRQILIDRVVYTCRHNRILQIFYEEEAELPKRLQTKVVRYKRAYQEVLVNLLERGLKEGRFVFEPSPMVVANCLLGACNWSYKWYNPRGPKSPEQLGQELSSLLMHAILAPNGRTQYPAGRESRVRPVASARRSS